MIIADTGFFYALANSKDRHHPRALEALKGCAELLVTTWPVLTETCHLLVTRMGVTAELAFMGNLAEGAFKVASFGDDTHSRILGLMRRYRDLPMDLADASLVVLAEDLGHGRIFSTDRRDFETYRWKYTKPFDNLLLP